MFDDAFVSQTEVDGWCDPQRRQRHAARRLRRRSRSGVERCSCYRTTRSTASKCATSVRRSAGPRASRSPSSAVRSRTARTGSKSPPSGFRRADPNSPLYGGLPGARIRLRHGQRSFEHLSNARVRPGHRCRRGRRQADLVHDRRRSFEICRPTRSGSRSQRRSSSRSCQTASWISRTASPTGGVDTWDFNDRTLILPFTLDTDPRFPATCRRSSTTPSLHHVGSPGAMTTCRRGSVDLVEGDRA